MLLRPAALAALLACPVLAQERGGDAPGLSPEGAASLPAEGQAGHGSLTFQLGVFNLADDGDGNPFLDEDLTVVEPVIIYDYDISDDLGLTVELSYDYVSSASIERLAEFPEQSGASRENYLGGDFALRHRLDERTSLRWHVGYSDEYDYDSIGAGISLTKSPRGTDATVAFGLNGYFDSVDIIRFDGSEEGSDERLSLAGSARWHQILSPTSFGELGLTVANQSGFLETPYNAVVIEDPNDPPNPNLENNARGTEEPEVLPDDRLRVALDGRVRKRIALGRAWELGSRLYGDSWDITSVSLEPAWYETFLEGRLDARFRYRFYVQSEAEYYQDSFTESERYQTQDSELAGYSSSTVGTKLVWHWSELYELTFGLDYSLRSDGLDHVFGYVGWSWSF